MAKSTIKLKSYNNIQEDLVAAGIITPGHLIERDSDNKFAFHSTAGGTAVPRFALEDMYQGKKITEDYAAADTVISWRPTPGDVVYAIFDATSGGSIALGDFVESAGDGTLRKYVPPPSGGVVEQNNTIVGQALEAATPGDRFECELM